MAAPRIARKWRPTLTMIVLAVLLTVLALPAATVIWFRALDNSTSQMGPIEIGALALALVLTIAISIVFSRTITGPINALIKRTEEIGKGGRGAIVAPEQQGTREIATLSQSFLDLAERLVDRTEYVSSFASHVSHELKSPVTAIRGSAELLRDAEMSAEERRRFLDHIIADSDRLSALLDSLRELARADLDATTGSSTITEAVAGQAVTLTGETDARLSLGPEAAKAVFGQLIRNAGEHGASAIEINAAREDGFLRIIVADNGAGISPGNRDRIFEPFFTTRRESGGTGMGLQIVRSMLAAHAGTIALLPSETGASFELRVPLA
ncbi:MAG: HAMP domain-containing sensor histidine kinase [Devosia sp.]